MISPIEIGTIAAPKCYRRQHVCKRVSRFQVLLPEKRQSHIKTTKNVKCVTSAAAAAKTDATPDQK